MTCCCCSEVWLTLAALVLAVYLFVQYKYSYWKRRNVPHTPPKFPFGSMQGISRTRNVGDVLKLKYAEGRGEPFVGIYVILAPGLLIRDPDLIKTVLTKEFTTFSARGFRVNAERDPLTGHLFFLDGAKWRNLRTKLTPTFTSGKMKMMYPIIENCSDEMERYLRGNSGQIIEVGDLFSRYTTNIVTRCAFGVDMDFFKNPDPQMQKMIHRVSNPTLMDAIFRGVAFSLGQFTKTLPLRIVPKELTDYFVNLVKTIMADREANGIQRNDFMQLLIELKNKGVLDDPDAGKHADANNADETKTDFTFNEAVAQAFSFLVGGFETSTSTLTMCLYELAKHQNYQDDVRAEIDKVLSNHGGSLSYDALNAMTFMEQVINETMRLHPIIPLLNRECTKPYRLPGSNLILQPGDKVWISTAGLTSDPTFFPEPEIFDPDRFSSERKSSIHPYTFLPFGDGPRTCIGNRFAMMQMKKGLATVISQFRIEFCEKTPVKLRRDPKKPLLSILGGVPLRFIEL